MKDLFYFFFNLLWGDLVTIPLPGGNSMGVSLLVLILIPAGIFFTLRLKFMPVRKFPEMVRIAQWMREVAEDFDGCAARVKEEVNDLCARFPIYD